MLYIYMGANIYYVFFFIFVIFIIICSFFLLYVHIVTYFILYKFKTNSFIHSILFTHSAQTVLPADVCADTSTDSLLSMHKMASRWNGSRTKGYSCKEKDADEAKASIPAAPSHACKCRSKLRHTLAAFPTRAFSGLYSSFRGSATCKWNTDYPKAKY